MDSRRVLRAGRPWIPVMGEFHFSRYPAVEWREELLKMRAGGINLVATYLFWNQHEEQRGAYRFDGDLDIRRFVELCAALGLSVAVRIGPWSHGECRNGGFPDWLAGIECVPRTDDPAYLALVRPYFARIAHELRGLWHRDGGPVIAVQVENELYDQPGHLATLRRMAEEAGADAPLWTATAWGGARIPPDVLLPLYGGYPEAFWEDAHPGWAREMRRHYFFTPVRDDHAIGADLRNAAPAGGPDDRRYPYATCELGGGMAIAYHRRPLVPERDVTALALTKIGSGSVWQGYYLYHGCSQRLEHGVPNQESHATGYPNDLPSVTYDFQAPLGEYGQVRPAYHALRRQHLLLHDAGAELADMPLSLPDARPGGLDDRTTLRWAVRSRGDTGFLFVNNHQPHEPLPDHEDVRFSVKLTGGTVTLPEEPVTVPSGAHFVWPLGYELGPGVRLNWAAAQPLTRLEIDVTPTAVLAATEGVTPRLHLPAGTRVEGPDTTVRVREAADGTLVTVLDPGTGALLTVHGPHGPVRVLVLSAEQGRQVSRVHIWGCDRLVLCDDLVLADGEELRVHTAGPPHRWTPTSNGPVSITSPSCPRSSTRARRRVRSCCASSTPATWPGPTSAASSSPTTSGTARSGRSGCGASPPRPSGTGSSSGSSRRPARAASMWTPQRATAWTPPTPGRPWTPCRSCRCGGSHFAHRGDPAMTDRTPVSRSALLCAGTGLGLSLARRTRPRRVRHRALPAFGRTTRGHRHRDPHDGPGVGRQRHSGPGGHRHRPVPPRRSQAFAEHLFTDPTETVRPFGDDLLKLAFPGAALERVPHSYYAAAAEPWAIRWLHTIGDELPDLLAAIGLRLPRRGP
ncbi:beta-galactosidase [Streptomyces cahuitamycinicus]|uniref:beta-galactosidase n=1 Tax=Streptomyces cahuitamycinicus TaxID=2070367 RepID=UPI001FE8DF13|nr:beta-galactosidase [Streptomyces cahuitamycinicus]